MEIPWGPVEWGQWQPGGFRVGVSYRQISSIRTECRTYLQRQYSLPPTVHRKGTRCKPWVPTEIWAESA